MAHNSGDNGIYGLVGEKLGHSFSPLLHAKFGNYKYDLMEIERERIEKFFAGADYDGVNVTIPYKETAMAYCTPDENARAIGCVNTLVNRDGVVRGYNTDTYGFEYMAKRAGIGFSGMKVVILGSGGTCRTAAYTASRLGAAAVTIVSRKPSEIGLTLKCPVSYVSYEEDLGDCDILINTTPVGMFPKIEGIPVDISNNYVNIKAVLDVVYNPLRTRLVFRALQRGIPTSGGLPMLVAQGYFAARLFNGGSLGADPVGELSDEDIASIESVIKSIEQERGNIVLTGMPGSGKSTVGKIIAQRAGLEFVDTDEIFEKKNKITPAECIVTNGEPHFRKLEKEAVADAASSGQRVIATGGGVVLDPENIEMLSLNGTIVYIHRKLCELATGNRPLSEGAENLKALYYKRLPIYLANNDMKICVEDDAETVADKIIVGLHNAKTNGNELNGGGRAEHMKILVLNGSNINMLGIREPDIYGHDTYDDLLRMCRDKASQLGVEVTFYQSNHEGDLVDIIQQSYGTIDGIVFNPGAFTHTSIAILDALKAVGIPTIEVHISDVDSREDYRQISYIRSYVRDTITGHGLAGYTEAMESLVHTGSVRP